MAEPLNTGLSAQQVLTAFDRALNDYTDAEIDALLAEKQDTISDIASIRSGAAAGATAVQQTAFETDQQRQEVEMGDIANRGAKNLMPINTVSFTSAGVGEEFQVKIPEGDYVFSCSCSATSSASHLYLFDSAHNEILHQPFTNSTNKKINLSIDSEVAFARFDSDIANNTISNIMIRYASITDPTFQPYALPNPTLTPAVIKAVDEGSKNIADMSKSSFTTLTKDSVTVTLSGDTITASGTGGTATNNFFNIFYVSNALLVPSGTWVISLVGTGINNFMVEEYDNVHSDVVKGDFGQPLTVTVPDNATQSYIRITSKPSTNCAGTFKLMICTAADWAVSQKFVPYRPSWQEMWEMIQALQSGS